MSDKKRSAEFLCRVVGVTFCNDDGESRQEIIKKIIDKYGDGSQWTGPGRLELVKREIANDKWDDYSIEVHVKGKCIGLVPKARKDMVSDHKRTQSGSVLVSLLYTPQYGACSAKVFTSNRTLPTKNMEYAVEKILKANPKLERPEKTFDAYREFLNRYRGGEVNQLRYKRRMIE